MRIILILIGQMNQNPYSYKVLLIGTLMKTHYYSDKIIEICSHKHLVVDDIYNELIKDYPEAGKSSIYRNVEELSKKGLLKKLIGVGKKTYFETNIGDHIHIIDEKTGEIFDLDLKDINIPNLPKNFKINSMDIKLIGEFG
ncbi:hypothetical protein A9Q91_03225 [Candidatus Gracilibacteria bacterium 28_42_T64]|nr:hypothetical protein A9Q91_03225 [Candidatus Gracilibacteria bacterium 28_42_T64]